jgi:hypothetical protein
MKIFFIIGIFGLLTSCNGQQPKTLGEAPLNLKKINFDLNVIDFYPKKYILKNSSDYFEIPIKNNLNISQTQLIKKDTVFAFDEYTSDKKQKPKWIEYRKESYSSIDSVAVFDKFVFNAINTVTTPDNKLIAINGLIDEIDKLNSDNFIKILNSEYGKNTYSKDKSSGKTSIYTWKNSDRIIKYCIVLNNENNTLKLELNEKEKTIKNASKKPHYVGYFYIIKKEYGEQLIGKMNTGDLSYCQ